MHACTTTEELTSRRTVSASKRVETGPLLLLLLARQRGDTKGVQMDHQATCHSLTLVPSRDQLERMGDDIAELAAHLQAATYQLLRMIDQFDRLQGWAETGARSCAHWLSWRLGIGSNAAREKVRVARALAELPLLSQAMQRGQLSFSMARAITRVATPENEAELLTFACRGSAHQVERLVRIYRGVQRAQSEEHEERQHESRALRTWTDAQGMLVIEGRLPPELGAAVRKALDLAEALLARSEEKPANVTAVTPCHAETSLPETAAQKRADALGLLAQSALGRSGFLARGSGQAADHLQVVLHVDAKALTHSNHPDQQGCSAAAAGHGVAGRCCFEHGEPISSMTARRLSCDSSRVTMLHGADGSVLSVGRKTRAIPRAIRRALMTRDLGCRFPGCNHQRYLQAHHLQHWATGGETRLDNLILLCSGHHRLLHEGGFSAALNLQGELVFSRPDGRVLPDVWPVPSVGEDGQASLVRANQSRGLDISHQTLPVWQGGHPDYGWAVEILLEADQAASLNTNKKLRSG